MADEVFAFKAVLRTAGDEVIAVRRAALAGSSEAARRSLVANELVQGNAVKSLRPIGLGEFTQEWDEWHAENRIW